MLKNYYEIDPDTSVETFLKNVKDKKNSLYIVLSPPDNNFYVDLRSISLGIKNPKEKLKSLKKPLSKSDSTEERDFIKRLIDSGDRVIMTNEGLYDFVDALKFILDKKYDFLNVEIKNIERKEVFALNSEDKISTAKSLFIKHKTNILPVIDENNKVIGEVRARDLLSSSLYFTDSGSSNFYNDKHKDSQFNLSIENISNKKPLTLSYKKPIRDAVKLMLDKKLPSLIITEEENLYSTISYKEVFKLLSKEEETPDFTYEIVGLSQLYDDEASLVEDYIKKSMTKISRMSKYDNLKVTFKSLGNTEGSTIKKKYHIALLLSQGSKVLNVSKEIVSGTNDEEYDDKVKKAWNVPKALQEALSALEAKVKDERRKSKSFRR